VTEYVALAACGHLFLESPAQDFLLYLPDIAVDKAPVNRIQYAEFQGRDFPRPAADALISACFSNRRANRSPTTEAQLFHGGER